MNKITVQGRLGQVPDLRWSKAGKPYCVGTIAVRKTMDYTQTNWFNFVAFGKLAERIAKCTKGQQVIICGGIDIDVVEGKESTKQYFTKLIAQEMYYCGSSSNDAGKSSPTDNKDEFMNVPEDADSLPFE